MLTSTGRRSDQYW